MIFLMIKIIICIFLIMLWLRECKKDPVQTLGNFFFILFIFTLIFDVFALNNKMITLKEKPINIYHLFINRTIFLPLSLFLFQRISPHFFKKIFFSIVWIIMLYFFIKLNEQFQVVKLKEWTLLNCSYMGAIIITLSLMMSYAFDKLARSRVNNAPTNKI
jgi:hypothetical protein